MPLLWTKGVNTGRINVMQFVALTSTNAAKTYNVYPRKGAVIEGADADVVVWDPTATKTISASTHQSCLDVNVFEGIEVRGVPKAVFLNGHMVVDDFKIVAENKGRYVRREPFAEYVYGGLVQRDVTRKEHAVSVKCDDEKEKMKEAATMTDKAEQKEKHGVA